MRHFRRNEFLDDLTSDQGPPLWEPFSATIVREMSEKEGKSPRWAHLIFRGETLAPPHEVWRKAYTEPEFQEPDHFFSWYPHEVTEPEIMLYGN